MRSTDSLYPGTALIRSWRKCDSRSLHVLLHERVELIGGSAVLFFAGQSRHFALDRRNFPVLLTFVRTPHVFAIDFSLERIRQSLVRPDRTWRCLGVRILNQNKTLVQSDVVMISEVGKLFFSNPSAVNSARACFAHLACSSRLAFLGIA